MKRLEFMHHFGILVAGLFLVFTIAIFSYHSGSVEDRAQYAKSNQGPIEIAAVWDLEEGRAFFDGAQLAAEQINAKGGARGRKVLLHEHLETSESSGLDIAKNVARRKEIVASIGHFNARWSKQAAEVYGRAEILFVATNVTEPSFCEFGLDLLFRTLPSDREFARALAARAARNDIDRWALYHVREDIGYFISKAIASAAEETGLRLVARKSYDGETRDFRPVIGSILPREYDGIILVDLPDRAGRFIKDLRRMNVDLPVLCSHSIRDPLFLEVAGAAAENSYVATVFDSNTDNETISEFVKSFRDRYGSTPDLHAAQGYEAVSLIGEAVNRGGSSVPIDLSVTLKHQGPWTSNFGEVTFSSKGAIRGKEIFFMRVTDGRFEVLRNE